MEAEEKESSYLPYAAGPEWIECDGELGYPWEPLCCHSGKCNHNDPIYVDPEAVEIPVMPLQLVRCLDCGRECADNFEYYKCKDAGHLMASYSPWPFVKSTDEWTWRKEQAKQ